MQIGDHFYWLPVRSIAGWTPGQQLICRSKVSSIHPLAAAQSGESVEITSANVPTRMIGNGHGYYLHQERCYSTLEEAKAALREWLKEQREMLDEIESELEEY